MLTIIFAATLIWFAFKLLILGIRVTWGIARVFCTVLLLPLFIIGIVYVGLAYFAIPIFVIIGIVVIIGELGRVFWRTHFT